MYFTIKHILLMYVFFSENLHILGIYYFFCIWILFFSGKYTYFWKCVFCSVRIFMHIRTYYVFRQNNPFLCVFLFVYLEACPVFILIFHFENFPPCKRSSNDKHESSVDYSNHDNYRWESWLFFYYYFYYFYYWLNSHGESRRLDW